jgi:hypothetical protein
VALANREDTAIAPLRKRPRLWLALYAAAWTVFYITYWAFVLPRLLGSSSVIPELGARF